MTLLTAAYTARVPRFRLGIRQKVLLVLLIVLLTALGVSGWLALHEEKANLLKEIDQRGSYIGRFVAKSMAFSVVGYDYHTIQLLLDELTSSDEIDYAKVTNVKGNTMGESGFAGWRTGVEQVASQGLMMFTNNIQIDNETVGTLHLGFSTTHIMKHMENQKFTLLKREALVILLIALGEFLALSYIIVRPVGKITDYLRSNVDDSGKLVGNIPLVSNDEFGQLAHQFNALSKQLNEANDKLHSKIESADKRLLKANQQLKQLNNEFKLLSITDPLTGLFNRRHFDELMEAEVGLSNRHGNPNSILLIDIDSFKAINDTYGHYVGDLVLKSIARTLQKNLRHTDAICRIGGEEFAVLCKRTDKPGAMETAEKLRAAVETTLLVPETDSELTITISIGVASIPYQAKNTTPEQLYKDVDTAMYYSKNNGRNRITHITDLHQEDSTTELTNRMNKEG
ncbi:MAG: diguanylate cyclase [Gammaproteobacteria bacterium]|nr:diguanylate cyclase [Gammaproteobacteria bacterium]